MTHGGYAFLRRYRDGSLDEREGRGRQLWEIRQRLARDLGAGSFRDLSFQQQLLVEDVAVKTVVLRLMAAFALSGDMIGENGKLRAPLGGFYLAWSNSRRLHLQALGLERRAKDAVLDLETHLERRYGGKDGAGT